MPLLSQPTSGAARNDRLALYLLGGLALAIIPLGALFAQGTPQRPYTIAETGRSYGSLQQAVDAIGDASGTIRIASGRWRDCAVQTKGSVGYVAQVPGQAALDGGVCEGKAALVLRGRSARVEGLIFARLRVPEANGAGIRLEHGDLAVTQSWFMDSNQGILTAEDPGGSILIEKSTFTRLGTCEGAGGCAHSLYIGNYGALTVRRCRFEQGRGGHYVKSRAVRIEIVQSSFDDSRGKATNYMVDLPGGASGTIAENWFVQGADKENYSAFIAVAAEGKAHTSNGLIIAANDARLAPNVDRTTTFVADWSGDRLALGDNRLGLGLKRFERR
ncbi:right-handed parallel beta-helix repeat-containing protein [Novosphingobium sp. Gsoil 351]|uniref:right-handed parallel beta-helix repeat-containing protein n=1 Tax=Novosphingobium sp. Gsoil 351 TaxID=2675225 RepID=UPI001E625BE6|nr:right-handed parallel beta-helix repeat-containing protein [Novosphingobium sp. Gsoil 351]